jgi:hypothetical protein
VKLARSILTLLVLITLVARSEPAEINQCEFEALIKPQGWELPKHGKPRIRRAITELEHLPKIKNIYRSDFGESGSMFLPRYFVEEQRLMLYSFEFRLTNLYVYDVKGKPFRYVAVAEGKHVGVVFAALWTDCDGDGIFEEYRSGGGHALDDLPKWVVDESGNQPAGNT